MRTLLTFCGLVATITCQPVTTFTPPQRSLPSFLIGEWAPSTNRYRGEELDSGFAMYLDTNGRGVWMIGPLDAPLRSTFDSAARTLDVAFLLDHDSVFLEVRFRYDDSAQRLIGAIDRETGELSRRRSVIPAGVRQRACKDFPRAGIWCRPK